MISPGDVFDAVVPRLGRRRRRVWERDGRAHIEVRGLDRPENGALATDVEMALAAQPGVEWARANGVTGRVVVSFDAAATHVGDLVPQVEKAEADHGMLTDPFPVDRPDHPGDREPLRREAIALTADVAALGLAVVGRMARLARLPVEIASLASVVQSQPRLRHALETHIGAGPTNVSLAALNAIGNGLAHGPLGLVADAGLRVSYAMEHVARRTLWNASEPELCRQETAGADAVAVDDRPCLVPAGPIEQYADRATAAGVAGLGITTVLTGNGRRGFAAFLATTPKAALQGREVFAAHVGAAFSQRRILVLDPAALRRLDRIDCVVVDARVAPSDFSVGDIAPIGGEVPLDVVHRLFDPAATRKEGPWTLRPLGPRSSLRRRLDVRRALRDLDNDRVLVLTNAGVPAAVVGVDDGPSDEVAELLECARRAGWRTEVHAVGPALDRVHSLQGEGHTVALVSSDAAALAAADCGIGIAGNDHVPWGCHVLCDRGLTDARFVVEAAAVAHEVSRQSAALALAGSSIAALLGFSVPVPMAAARAMAVVNVAAMAAQANGVRAAVSLRRRAPRTRVTGPPLHALPAADALEHTSSSRAGLTSREAAARRRLEDVEETSLPTAMLEELANPLTPVLAGAAALSSVVGSATDAVIVGAVTLANAALGGAQRWRVDRAVRAMEEASGQFVRVRRDGEVELLSAEVVVPGDVIFLEAGDSVPADCRIIEADGLEVDESSLTGESVPVAKSPDPSASRLVAERSSMLYDGSTIAAGTAEAVVVAVGADTEAGGAASLADHVAGRTGGVEARLSNLVAKSLPVSAGGGALVTISGLARGIPLRQTLHSGVSLAVAAVPEGLPLLATIAQVNAARRLAGHGVLVRNPRAIEALGRVDVLCADKTGTLTQGEIRLHRVSDGERDVKLDALGEHHCYVLAVALRASPEERGGDDPLPHLTDRAVVEGAASAGISAANGGHPWQRRAELPFEPARGYHAVLGRNGEGYLLSVKGAPEVVLPRCGDWHDGGTTREIDAAVLARLVQRFDRLARRGYRILAVAERRATGKRDLDDDRVARLTLLGFVALADPVRPEAARAVARLRAAGVRTVMMTGDHPSTAEGIAHELGILEAGRVLIGPEIDELDDEALGAVLPHVTVFARVTPAQKLRLVGAYQSGGHAVAMTGDGANDAPAIRMADVGVALGEHSTSGARRAADVVVPDGRIEALLDAVVEGRAMWASVREAVAILLGGNLGETVFTVAGAALTGHPPLNARQLLLVNLLTDALPAMAIAGRAPRDVSPGALLAEGPDASLGRSLDRAIVARAVTTAGGAAMAWAGARMTGRAGGRAGTVALAALVGTQLGQTLGSGGRDPVVAVAALGSAAALAGVIMTPGVSQVFGCTPLGPVGWTVAGASTGAALLGSAIAPSVFRAAAAAYEKVTARELPVGDDTPQPLLSAVPSTA